VSIFFRAFLMLRICVSALRTRAAAGQPVAQPPTRPFAVGSVRGYSTVQIQGTHNDFAPKTKDPKEADLQAAIEEMRKDIRENHIVLFMKGEPKQPSILSRGLVFKLHLRRTLLHLTHRDEACLGIRSTIIQHAAERDRRARCAIQRS